VILSHTKLRSLIREQFFLQVTGEEEDYVIDPPDSTDAWHPSDVVPLDDAWAGGDNIDTPVDHSYVETGESNAGNHSPIGFSGEPEPLGDDELEFSPCDGTSLVDLVFLRETDGDLVTPEEALVSDELIEPEREAIVIQIKNRMDDVGISGETKGSMLSQVDNADEFEDLIRFIFDEAGLNNRQLAGVALSIAKDFQENPDTAASLSTFNT